MNWSRTKTSESNRVASLGKLLIFVSLAVVVGQISMWLSGAWSGHEGVSVSELTPPPYLMGIIWTIIYGLAGAGLYMLASEQVYTLRSQRLKNTGIALWVMQYVLMMVLPFAIYAGRIYMLGFVISSLIISIIAAESILSIRIAPASTLIMLPVLGYMMLETYLTLILMLNNF